MNEAQPAPYRHLRGPGAFCFGHSRRGPRDRILIFLYKWEDLSAPGLEAESFTGEEKLNENHPVPQEPFPQGQAEGRTVHAYLTVLTTL